jgi:sugar O-acyltransferase (sialic acid O-acetyltransferase NeuD family)
MQVVVYGSRADGHAKVCIEALELLGWTCIGCLDDYESNQANVCKGHRVIGGRERLAELASQGVDGVVLGFGSGRGRLDLVTPVRKAGLALPVLIHPAAFCSPSASIADGAQVLAGAVVSADARVGAAALVNTGAIVSHDVVVSDGASLAPGVVLAGRSTIGAGAEIGAGATVLPDRVVGEDAVVGAGAVVVHDVPAKTTVAGVPARPLTKR